MHENKSRIEKNATKRRINSAVKSSKPKMANMSSPMIYNNKQAYMKNFFKRRYQIQMQVRKKVFQQVKEYQKINNKHENNSIFGSKRQHLKIQQNQRHRNEQLINERKSYKSGKSRKASKSKQTSKNHVAQKQGIQRESNLYSNWEMTTKKTKQTANSQKKDDFRLDLKSLLQQKNKDYRFHRDPCSDKRIHKQQNIINSFFNNCDQNAVNPQKQEYKQVQQQQEYVYNPKKYKYMQVNYIEEIHKKNKNKQTKTVKNRALEQKDISEYWPLSSIRNRMEEESHRGRSNGFKYAINEQFRQKLASMLAKQRSRNIKPVVQKTNIINLLKSQTENDSISDKKHLNQFHLSWSKQQYHRNKQIEKILKVSNNPQIQYSMSQECQTPKMQQKSSLLTQLLSELVKKQKQQKLHRKNEKLTIASQYNEHIMIASNITHSIHQKCIGNEYQQQKMEEQSKEQCKEQESQIICAICQTNITNKLWKYAIFYSKREEEEYFNFHELFVEGTVEEEQSIEYRDEEVPLLLDCGHSYHRVCLQQWFKYKTLCPLCKSAPLQTNEQVYEISVSNHSYYDEQFTLEEEEDQIYSNSIYGMDYSDRFIPITDYYRGNNYNNINVRINRQLNLIESEMEASSELVSVENSESSNIESGSMPISQTRSRFDQPSNYYGDQSSNYYQCSETISLTHKSQQSEGQGNLSQIINQFSIQDVKNSKKQSLLEDMYDDEGDEEGLYSNDEDSNQHIFTSNLNLNFQQSF